MQRSEKRVPRKVVPLALLAASLAGASTSGCTQQLHPRVEPAKFTEQWQAGTGHVAVLSVAPWEDLVTELQPTFHLSPDGAYDLAGATTAATERRLLDMLKVVLQAATPSSSTKIDRTASSQESTSETGEVTRTSDKGRTATESEGPGELPTGAPSLPESFAASKLPGFKDVLGKEPPISTGAFTQYLLANALYQEVQLLNHYLEFAAVRNGYDAYVARLQVSLMPSVRNGPYDAYTTIGFFPSDVQAALAPVSRGSASKQLPVVIPLLVTDDMEAALASDSSDVVRQYALALSAMIRGFSLRGDVERYTDELVTTVTKDFNSLHQVARLDECSVRVRMGARLHSSGQYFMVPQTHNVTVLLLTPRTWSSEAEVFVEARTEFRDVTTGVSLAPRNRGSTLPAMREQFDLFGFDSNKVTDEDLERLRLAGNAKDFPTFRSCVIDMWRQRTTDHRPTCPTCPYSPQDEAAYEDQTARRLWIALASMAVGGQYTSTTLTLPPRSVCALPGGIGASTGAALAYGTDDGVGSLDVELRPVLNIHEDKVGVRLLVGKAPCGKTEHAKPFKPEDILIAVPAEDVYLVRSAQLLKCRFPSLARTFAGDGKESALQLLKKGAPYVTRLSIENPRLACGPYETCTPSTSTQYDLLVTYVRRGPPAEDPMAKVSAMPALRVTGSEKAKLTVEVARTSATPMGAVKVRLWFVFMTADGKPASGVVEEADKVSGCYDVELDGARKALDFTLAQLAPDSVLHISTVKVLQGPDVEFDAAPSGKASVLIFVTPPQRAAAEPKSGASN